MGRTSVASRERRVVERVESTHCQLACTVRERSVVTRSTTTMYGGSPAVLVFMYNVPPGHTHTHTHTHTHRQRNSGASGGGARVSAPAPASQLIRRLSRL